MSERKRKKKLGRPTIYTPELAASICAELACGKSLRTVCKANDMPDNRIPIRPVELVQWVLRLLR